MAAVEAGAGSRSRRVRHEPISNGATSTGPAGHVAKWAPEPTAADSPPRRRTAEPRPPGRVHLEAGPGHTVRTVRATMGLIVVSLGLGLAVASALGLVFWAVASAIHQASS
ncbi:MAG: hypothetical protein JO337_04150 [Acidimicrobiales bacterium]|nr:hypothetical protein [Acidimicrobiales bacterium]